MYYLADCIERDTSAADISMQLLYGVDGKNFPTLSPEAKKLLKEMEQAGLGDKDWRFLTEGTFGRVWANKQKVFKLHLEEVIGYKFNAPADIVRDFGTQTYLSGSCNGVRYHADERLNTKEKVTLAEMIPFFFKLYARGYIYEERNPANYGYNADGELRALDNKYFLRSQNKEQFAEALSDAVTYSEAETFPVITCDDKHTYLILEPTMGEKEFAAQKKKLEASLKAVGLGKDDIAIIPSSPPVFSITGTQVNVGMPPEPQPLEDFIDRVLKTTTKEMKPDTRASYLLEKLGNTFADYPAIRAALPAPAAVSQLGEVDFQQWRRELARQMEKTAVTLDVKPVANRVMDNYFRQAYQTLGR
jgi:hypothetical protein